MAFHGIMGRYIVVYLDDLTVFSKDHEKHIFHLQDVLERCCKHGISLNPNKLVFGVTEGKLLGHVVSKEGIKLNLERVKSIQLSLYGPVRLQFTLSLEKLFFCKGSYLSFQKKLIISLIR